MSQNIKLWSEVSLIEVEKIEQRQEEIAHDKM